MHKLLIGMITMRNVYIEKSAYEKDTESLIYAAVMTVSFR